MTTRSRPKKSLEIAALPIRPEPSQSLSRHDTRCLRAKSTNGLASRARRHRRRREPRLLLVVSPADLVPGTFFVAAVPTTFLTNPHPYLHAIKDCTHYSDIATLRKRTFLPRIVVKENRHEDPNSIDVHRSDPADFFGAKVATPSSLHFEQGVLRISRG